MRRLNLTEVCMDRYEAIILSVIFGVLLILTAAASAYVITWRCQ